LGPTTTTSGSSISTPPPLSSSNKWWSDPGITPASMDEEMLVSPADPFAIKMGCREVTKGVEMLLPLVD